MDTAETRIEEMFKALRIVAPSSQKQGEAIDEFYATHSYDSETSKEEMIRRTEKTVNRLDQED